MSGRTSDDIRREIERKRAEMDGTVDALDRKLSPGRLLDHALWMLRGSDTGSQKARAAGDAVTGFAKDHPIPVALMSAGAAWLAAESRQGHAGDTGAGTYAPAEGRTGPYMGDALDEGELHHDGRPTPEGDEGNGVTDRAREKATDLKHRVTDATAEATDRLRDTGESVRDRVESLGDRARAKARAAGDRSADLARRAREQTSLRADLARERYVSTLEENPLAIGAAAFGLGLAAGLSAPTTRWENERVGPTADALKGEARSIGSDAARAARSAGSEALSVVKREALPENIVDEVKERAKRVASDAANAAKERARAEGLSADVLKERAREAAAHTRDAARGDQPRQSAAIEDLT